MPLLKQLASHAKETAETKAALLVLQQEVHSTKKNLMDARVTAEMKRARSNSPPRRESVMTRDCVSYQSTLGDQKKELLAIQEKFKQVYRILIACIILLCRLYSNKTQSKDKFLKPQRLWYQSSVYKQSGFRPMTWQTQQGDLWRLCKKSDKQ